MIIHIEWLVAKCRSRGCVSKCIGSETTSHRDPARWHSGLMAWLMSLLGLLGVWADSAQGQAVDGVRTRCAVIEFYPRDNSPRSAEMEAEARRIVQEESRRSFVSLRVLRVAESPRAAERFRQIQQFFRVPHATPPALYGCQYLIHDVQDINLLESQLKAMLTVNVFVRPGCQHCEAAKAFLARIQPRFPCFHFAVFDVTRDEHGLKFLQQLIDRHQTAAVSYPVFHYCNEISVGFVSEQVQGQRILDTLTAWTVPCPPPQRPPHTSRRALPKHPGAINTSRAPVPRFSHFDSAVSGAESWETVPGVTRENHFPSRSEIRSVQSAWAPLGLTVARVQVSNRSGMESESEVVLPAIQADEVESRGQSEESPATPPDQDSLAEDPFDDLPPIPLPGGGDVEGLPGFPDRESALPGTAEQDSMEVPVLGQLSASRLGMPVFTILVGLVDGFNPCAMWVLLFLLSVLVNLKSRAKILAVAGTFVVISGLAYFVFMAAWMNFFLLVGYLRPVQILLGTLAIGMGAIHVKDFFAFKRGITLSIPDSAKPGIYSRVRRIVTAENLWGAIAGASVLAVLVNLVELLCTAGLPALYSQILTQQGYPAWKNYAYLGLYILAYMFDDALMVALIVITLDRRKLQESQGRWLKLLSGTAIILLGAIMLFRPQWLM